MEEIEMKELKYVGIAALALAGIIAVQIGLTYLFTFRVGEIFSQTTMRILFFYILLRCCRKQCEREAAKKAAA